MRRHGHRVLFLVSGIIFLLTPQSFAYEPKEGNVSALVGPFFSKTQFSDDRVPQNQMLMGFEIRASGDLNDKAAVEVAIVNMRKRFYRVYTPDLFGEQANLIHINMGYRRWLANFLSVGAHFYSSYSVGDPLVTYSDVPVGAEVGTSARDITEYGMEASIQIEPLTIGRFGLVLDSRYSWSLTAKQHEAADHVGFFVGLRTMVQEGRGGK